MKFEPHHQQQHHEHEQIQVGEEPVEARVAVHVAGGEDVYPEADERDDEHHHERQLVDLVAPLDIEVGERARFCPSVLCAAPPGSHVNECGKPPVLAGDVRLVCRARARSWLRNR